MAKQKQKWTPEEMVALNAGVKKHGHGKWKLILSDPQFASSLADRSNIDLKDKWRNLSVSGNESCSREGIRTHRLKVVATPEPISTVPLLEYGGMAGSYRSRLDRIIGDDGSTWPSRNLGNTIIADGGMVGSSRGIDRITGDGGLARSFERKVDRVTGDGGLVGPSESSLSGITGVGGSAGCSRTFFTITGDGGMAGPSSRITSNGSTAGPSGSNIDWITGGGGFAGPFQSPANGVTGDGGSTRPSCRLTDKIIGNVGMAGPSKRRANKIIDQDGTARRSRSKMARTTGRKYEYKVMIIEAVFNIDNLEGTDENAIFEFMERRYGVPSNARRSVYSMIRGLVVRGELQKVGNWYKFKDSVSGVETSQQEDARTNRKKRRKAPQDVTRNRKEEEKAHEITETPVAIEVTPKFVAKPLRIGTGSKSSNTPLHIKTTPKSHARPLSMKKTPEIPTALLPTKTTPKSVAAPKNSTTSFAPKKSSVATVGVESSARLRGEKAPERSATPLPTETFQDATMYAAYAVDVAEKLDHDVKEACKRADMILELLEERKEMRSLAEDLHEQCSRDGKVMLKW